MPIATVLSGGFALNNTPPATPSASGRMLPLLGVGLLRIALVALLFWIGG